MTPKVHKFQAYPNVEYWNHVNAFDFIGQQRHAHWPSNRIRSWAELERFTFRVTWCSDVILVAKLDIREKKIVEWSSATTWRVTGQTSARHLSYDYCKLERVDYRLDLLRDVLSIVVSACDQKLINGIALSIDHNLQPGALMEFTPTYRQDDESWLVDSLWTGYYRRPEQSGTPSLHQLYWPAEDIHRILAAAPDYRNLRTLSGLIDEILINSPDIKIGQLTQFLVEKFPDDCRIPNNQSDDRWIVIFGEHKSKKVLANNLGKRRTRLKTIRQTQN